MTTKLTRQGMYTVHARKMVRDVIAAGAAREKVGPLMSKIAQIFGVKIHRNHMMSRRTASRCVLEGGIASQMQNGFELPVTISADSTSNRGNNFESAKFQHRVPDYQKDLFFVDPTSTPRIRHSGVESTVDHSSQQSVAGWKKRVEGNTQVFNDSPLAARRQMKFTFRIFLRILKGMNGDH
ncbi:hypothetical protein B0H15DRAFT_780514, partial [Mycena belliarum]